MRNELYIVEATKLFVEAGRRALDACPDIEAADVTHVVTVSCTGFYAPGPDYMLVRELGLSPATQRYHLGFMGCYASMPALRTAKTVRRGRPACGRARGQRRAVLAAPAHLQRPGHDRGSSLFADGAAAGIVSGRPPEPGEVALNLDHFETVITPVGEGDMAWKIGDEGFEMVLSSYVPHIIDEHIEDALAPLLGRDASLAGLLPREQTGEDSRGAVEAVEELAEFSPGFSPGPWSARPGRARPGPTSRPVRPARPRRRGRAWARPSRTGRSIRAGAASSTRPRPSWGSARPSWCPRGRRSASTAT